MNRIVTKSNKGFSLIELVVVVAVLAILSAIGIPSFNAIIKQALLAITKTSLNDSYKQCEINPDAELNLSNIPGVVFQANDCTSDITATINRECTLKMNMSTGAKTGWTNSYGQCVSTTNNSSGNGNGDGNGSNDDVLTNYCNSDPKPSSCQTTGLGGYAVVQEDGTVAGVIVATSDDPWGTGNPGVMPMEYMGCPAGCRLIKQTNPSETGNVSGWSGQNVNYSNGVFTLEDGTQIKDGVGIRPNGEMFDSGTKEILN